eukprot:c16570_g1_i1.p1 GENE.c16570_g1_i1~~c16570_g1_i1.p1  ORF type:complete len:452 (+),score=51.95 c16570_g1_i1:1-1356(+)
MVARATVLGLVSCLLLILSGAGCGARSVLSILSYVEHLESEHHGLGQHLWRWCQVMVDALFADPWAAFIAVNLNLLGCVWLLWGYLESRRLMLPFFSLHVIAGYLFAFSPPMILFVMRRCGRLLLPAACSAHPPLSPFPRLAPPHQDIEHLELETPAIHTQSPTEKADPEHSPPLGPLSIATRTTTHDPPAPKLSQRHLRTLRSLLWPSTRAFPVVRLDSSSLPSLPLFCTFVILYGVSWSLIAITLESLRATHSPLPVTVILVLLATVTCWAVLGVGALMDWLPKSKILSSNVSGDATDAATDTPRMSRLVQITLLIILVTTLAVSSALLLLATTHPRSNLPTTLTAASLPAEPARMFVSAAVIDYAFLCLASFALIVIDPAPISSIQRGVLCLMALLFGPSVSLSWFLLRQAEVHGRSSIVGGALLGHSGGGGWQELRETNRVDRPDMT